MGYRAVKKLQLYKNGDASFKPIPYTYNSTNIRSFEGFLRECEERVPLDRGGGVRKIYAADDGRQIISLQELETMKGEAIVIAGRDHFMPVKGGYESVGLAHKKKSPHKSGNGRAPYTSYVEKNRTKFDVQPKYDQYKLEVKRLSVLRGGDPDFKEKLYVWRSRQIRTWEALLADLHSIAPPIDEGKTALLYTLDGEEVTNFKQLQSEQKYVVCGPETGFLSPYSSGPLSIYDLNKKDKEKNGHRSRSASARNARGRSRSRSKSAASYRSIGRSPRPDGYQPIMQREDQIKPQALTIQVTTMDGKIVKSVLQLENKGAYVLIPHGEHFRDAWYFLPDGVLDTSKEARKERDNIERATLRTAVPKDEREEYDRSYTRDSETRDRYDYDRDDFGSDDNRGGRKKDSPPRREDSDTDTMVVETATIRMNTAEKDRRTRRIKIGKPGTDYEKDNRYGRDSRDRDTRDSKGSRDRNSGHRRTGSRDNYGREELDSWESTRGRR